MLVFSLDREQAWNPTRHVEKILGTVAGGDVTVACWEPGQISPYHCHPTPPKSISAFPAAAPCAHRRKP
jgi:hypothetical protein